MFALRSNRGASMSSDRKRTRAEERELAKSMARIEALEDEWKLYQILERSIPYGWRRLHEKQPTTPPKTKLTLALDADMVAWYRQLGRGYQPHMNGVLRAYMEAVIAKAIEREGDRNWKDEPI